jgi:undecaprenyl phosphate N,N'-diacetylbacillosamine 1-phosphate transferase
MIENDKKQDTIPIVRNTVYSKYIKRILDVALSGIALICFGWLFLVIAILELIFHGRPILYKTRRPGKDGKIFYLYKFRSMTNKHGEDGLLLPESKRLTKFGRIIRKTSVDELPELFNILKGELSIIGPRPLLTEYLPLYSERHAYRHAVRPGLACVRIKPSESKSWTWGEQFENDIWYIEHISFMTDVKMVFAVVKEAIKGADYRADDTRVPFTGDNLYETRSRNEVGDVIRYNSISR